jgi:energy-coupling factor transport system ATP-binding protein
MADAALTAAMIVALLAAGRVLAAGSMMQVVASFVVAVLAARRRTRAVVMASAAAACIALILGGLGPVSQAALAGVFGWCGGQSLRRGWGRIRTVAFTLLIAWPAMAASVLLFFPAIAINRKLRDLVFENVENQADGMANILGGIGSLFDAVGLGIVDRALGSVGNGLQNLADFLIDNWLLLIPATELVYSVIYALLIRAVGGGILRRLERSLVDPLELDVQPAPEGPPVPLALNDVVLERNGVPVTAPLTLDVQAGEHLVIEGPNGAGKSTLLDALAGLDNLGSVERPSDVVGLGHVGGTARVGQRPEAQVIGTTVGEDLAWGLDDDFDVTETLAGVGLELPEDRPTSELSGGELQRLALASALRRKPKLLLADEVTSMLDPREQARIIDRLEALNDATIVRTTHRDDAVASDRRIVIRRASHNAVPATDAEAAASMHQAGLQTIRTNVGENRLIRLRDVAYSHAAGKPWALPVLHDVDLSIHRYELVIIEGRNGSGKTTLARILAGLETPTSGEVDRTSGVRRALAHQHVRLQLLRATVDEELTSLAGVRTDRESTGGSDQQARTENLETAIKLFELERLSGRRIDELSGGEQRRVLLAGLVSRGVSLLVLDEPLAGLDAEGRADLARTLDHVRLAGTSIVVVSHDVDWTPSHISQHLRLEDGRLRSIAPGIDGTPHNGGTP